MCYSLREVPVLCKVLELLTQVIYTVWHYHPLRIFGVLNASSFVSSMLGAETSEE